MDSFVRGWSILHFAFFNAVGFVLGAASIAVAQVPGSQPIAQPGQAQRVAPAQPPSFQSPALRQQGQQQQFQQPIQQQQFQQPIQQQQFQQPVQQQQFQQPVQGNPAGAPVANNPNAAPAAAHPLDPEINFARQRMAAMEQNIQDYSCIFTKREMVDGKLLPYEQMFMKVRHHPFSVYMYFLGPEDVKGQQVVYVEGQNNGKMVAQPIGLKGKFGPYYLDPNGTFAMAGQRYPITNAGFLNLTKQLVEEGMRDRQYPQCEVKQFKGAKVAGRTCTVTEITHPQLPQFQYHKARIFVDDEWNIPIRLESYLWPQQPGGQPPVLEEYTYSNLKFNNGFTDADFVIREE